MPQRQQDLIKRRIHKAFHLFALPILFGHLIPVEIDNACEYIGVELCVLDMAEMLSQRLAGQCLGFSSAAFIPTSPPTFYVLALVYPCLLHSLIVSTVLCVTVTDTGRNSNASRHFGDMREQCKPLSAVSVCITTTYECESHGAHSTTRTIRPQSWSIPASRQSHGTSSIPNNCQSRLKIPKIRLSGFEAGEISPGVCVTGHGVMNATLAGSSGWNPICETWTAKLKFLRGSKVSLCIGNVSPWNEIL